MAESWIPTSTSSTVSTVVDSDTSSASDTEEGTIVSPVVSMLDKLRSPTVSSLSRKRSVHCNLPPSGKKRSSGTRKYDPKSVSPAKRVSEFTGEELTASAGRLFCKACRETLSLKRSSIVNHIKSSKHLEGKKKLATKHAREMNIAHALKDYNENVHGKGETLPEEQQVFRVQVLTTFLKAGVPLAKLKFFRDILESGGSRLTDTRHMLDLIPFIQKQEATKIKDEISGQYVSLIFDGTTRLGEVLVIILRFVTDWKVEERLVRLEFLQKSLTGEEIAREIINVLSVKMGVAPHLLLATMRDRASVNNLAMRTINVIYPNMLDIGCFSHALDHVGENFKTPTLDDFCSSWIMSKALWKEQTDKSIITYSKTRWWSRWEVMHQLFLMFEDVRLFLMNNADIGPACRRKLLQILNDPQQNSLLQIELAATIDLGQVFVKATYRLEGSGALVFECYEVIKGIIATIHTAHYPNVQANNVHQQQWVNYAGSCLKPGIDYFLARFGNDTVSPLSAFKAARLFSPRKVSELQPVAADVDTLSCFPFLKDESTLSALKGGLATYLVKAEDVTSNVDLLPWWKSTEAELPTWASAMKKLLLVQPSSASAERVFSLLNNSFNDKQFNTLEDYVETSIMLQFNTDDDNNELA